MSFHSSLLIIHLLLLALRLPASLSQPSVSSSIAAQRQALLSLKQQWRDPAGHLSGWEDSPRGPASFCAWTGIACDNASSSVVGLSLPRLLLGGTLSDSIGLLPSLQTLVLSGNRLTGPIPPQIGNLTQLLLLDLSFNALTGQLPAQSFPALSLLRKLDLSSNQLSGPFPAQLGSLRFLQDLRLRRNFLNGTIPGALSSASSLRFLLIEENNLSGEIPSSIVELRNLLYLAAGSNSLTGAIPPGLGDLTRLSAIYLDANRLSGTIPAQLGNLPRLIYLHLGENLLEGEIPPSLGRLSQLRELDLHQNKLSGPLPGELGLLNVTETLDLSSNALNGSIPASLGNMSFLTHLNLSHNNFSGQVPTNGVLASVTAAAYEGNGFLCGGPLANIKCAAPSANGNGTNYANGTNNAGESGSSRKLSRKAKIIIAAVAGGFALILIITALVTCLVCWPKRRRETVQIQSRFSPDLSGNLRRAKLHMFVRGFKYNYQEIVSHAGYYDTAHVLGKGRFATVYRSDLPGGTRLAVKVLNNPVPQPVFEKEIEALEAASHASTLLPISGYYSNPVENVVICDYVARGTLYDVLHDTSAGATSEGLDWARRLNIAMGVAQGMAHLHRGSSARVLHKDLKSTNVLLDEGYVPLVADYGLVGLVTKAWVETPGYTPPELRSAKRYSEKTDVYCFGVVLLELLTRKKPVSYIGERELSLVTWVVRLHKDGRGHEVFDRQVTDTCPFPDYPERALKLAVLCVSDQPALRPTMSEVASILEGLGATSSPVLSPRPDRPLLV